RLRVLMSRFLILLGSMDRAERSASDAVALLEAHPPAAADAAARAGQLATAYQQLGFTQARRMRSAAALESLNHALVHARTAAEGRPADRIESARLARIEADYGERLTSARRAGESLVVLRDAERRSQELV